jgi:hypothetical protein
MIMPTGRPFKFMGGVLLSGMVPSLPMDTRPGPDQTHKSRSNPGAGKARPVAALAVPRTRPRRERNLPSDRPGCSRPCREEFVTLNSTRSWRGITGVKTSNEDRNQYQLVR